MYICSPYRGDIERNVSKAKGYCRFAVTQGVIPIAPHTNITQFMDDNDPEERGLGLEMGLEMLKLCQELWVFGSRISEGMAAEIDEADRLGIPIYYYTDRCKKQDKYPWRYLYA